MTPGAQLSISTVAFPKLLEFGKHLLLILNQNSLILKNPSQDSSVGSALAWYSDRFIRVQILVRERVLFHNLNSNLLHRHISQKDKCRCSTWKLPTEGHHEHVRTWKNVMCIDDWLIFLLPKTKDYFLFRKCFWVKSIFLHKK